MNGSNVCELTHTDLQRLEPIARHLSTSERVASAQQRIESDQYGAAPAVFDTAIGRLLTELFEGEPVPAWMS